MPKNAPAEQPHNTNPAVHEEGWGGDCTECTDPWPCAVAKQVRAETGRYPGH